MRGRTSDGEGRAVAATEMEGGKGSIKTRRLNVKELCWYVDVSSDWNFFTSDRENCHANALIDRGPATIQNGRHNSVLCHNLLFCAQLYNCSAQNGVVHDLSVTMFVSVICPWPRPWLALDQVSDLSSTLSVTLYVLCLWTRPCQWLIRYLVTLSATCPWPCTYPLLVRDLIHDFPWPCPFFVCEHQRDPKSMAFS